MSASGVEIQQKQAGNESANFILRRAVSFLPKPLKARSELQEVAVKHDDYERSSTLEDKSRNDDLKPKISSSSDTGKTGKDVGHRTVIYFGDSNPRQKEDRARQQPSSSSPPPLPPEICARTKLKCIEDPETSSRPRGDEVEVRGRGSNECSTEQRRENDENNGGVVMANGETKVAHEIVVNVSPSREDVLRIEEDESQQEDYWSLPGDTSGFKADWSFVQQWRLRG